MLRSRHFILCFLLGVLCPALPAAAQDASPGVTAWPLAYHRQTAEGSQTRVLLFKQERQGSRRRTAIQPFIFERVSDPEKDYRHTMSLFYLSRFKREGEKVSDYIFPVYWRGHRPDRRWLHIWPLFGTEQKKTIHRYSTLFPFFRYEKDRVSENWSLDAPWPLVEFHRRGEHRGERILPLYWRHRQADSNSLMIFPYLRWRGADTRGDALLPFWYRQRKGGKKLDLLLPVYYRLRTEDKQTSLLLPFWYRKQRADSDLKVLFPLYFDREKNDHRQRLLFPFYYRDTDRKSRFTTVFPLYWNHRGQKSRLRLLLPIHGRRQSRNSLTDVWFPLYFRFADLRQDSDLRYYFPFYGRYRRGESVSRHLFLFPLYSHYADTEREFQSWNFLWPLIHYDRAPDAYQSWALPLYWHSRSPEMRRSMFLGLYWSGRERDKRFTALFPFYWHRQKRSKEDRHILPLYSSIARGESYRKRFFLGPLFIRTEDNAKKRSQTDVLWPLIQRERKGDKRRSRFIPFYLHRSEPGSSLSIGTLALLPPYYVREKRPERYLHHLWPFYGYRQKGSFRERSVLWPLLRLGSDPNSDRISWQLLLAYRDKKGPRSHSGFFPIWHQSRSPKRSKNLSLLHWYRRNATGPDRQFSLLHLGDPDLSLFTARRRGEEKHRHLFPLYSYTRAPSKKNLSILGPLFTYRARGEERRKIRFLWKTLYFDRQPDKRESGFLWRLIRFKETKGKSLFEFNPFYYREKKASGETYRSYLGGIYASTTGEKQTRRRLLWLFKW